jgi:hypothetical protein
VAVGIGILPPQRWVEISEHEDVRHFMRDNVSVHVESRANIRMPHELFLHRQSEFPRPPAGDGTFPVAATLPTLQCARTGPRERDTDQHSTTLRSERNGGRTLPLAGHLQASAWRSIEVSLPIPRAHAS